MNINFNNITDAYKSNQIALNKIYGRNGLLLWERSSEPLPGEDYLTMEVTHAGKLWVYSTVRSSVNPSEQKLLSYKYSLNGNEWTQEFSTSSRTSSSNARKINLNVGDIIKFKSIDDPSYYVEPGKTNPFNFCSDRNLKFNLSGNPMSLINYNVMTNSTLTYRLNDLFYYCNGVVNTNNLRLPYYTLCKNCFDRMFEGCANLISVPSLPATTLADNCYRDMFNSCTSLTSTMSLSATILYEACYFGMFEGCSSLTNIAQISATTLAKYCCKLMFGSCSSLTTAPELPALNLHDNCYEAMFSECTSLISGPTILPATILTYGCYYNMFDGCSSLTTAPVLPATTLVSYCYYQMFRNTNLNYIKAMFTTTPGTNYTQNWMLGVASSGTFVKNSTATWNVTGVNGVPTNWTIQYASS